jgi:hypothetical protein
MLDCGPTKLKTCQDDWLGSDRSIKSSFDARSWLAGCGGSQPPIGAPGAMPQTAALQSQSAQPDDLGSWMLPDATSQDLLYVSSHSWVSVYTYPLGHLVGKLGAFDLASGQCVDSSSSVYVTDYATGRIYEFPHGGRKRLRTLFMAGANSCSIDPTTGNLAVTSLGGTEAWIFENGKLVAKYKNSQFYSYYGCAYDANAVARTRQERRPTTSARSRRRAGRRNRRRRAHSTPLRRRRCGKQLRIRDSSRARDSHRSALPPPRRPQLACAAMLTSDS